MSEYGNFDSEGLKNKGAIFSPYQVILNQDPLTWTLEDAEVKDDRTKLTKKIKIMRLAAVYFLLDAIYQNYNISMLESKLIGKAMIVTVRLETIDKDGVVRFRDGSGSADASEGLKNATAMAEALAIKNAAKKLGRLFGRDLYSEDEIKREPVCPDEENNYPGIDLYIQPNESKHVDSDDVNPVFESIAKQLITVKNPEDLKAIAQNVEEKSNDDQLDGSEYVFLTDLINKKHNELNKKVKNGSSRKTNPIKGRKENKVPVSLSRRTPNKKPGGNKRGQV